MGYFIKRKNSPHNTLYLNLIAMLMQFWVRFMPLAFENYGWGL